MRTYKTLLMIVLLHSLAVMPAWSSDHGAVRSVPGNAAASIYVADFVSTAATGNAMNNSGAVAGTSYTDPGCGSSCLPPNETVVWKNGLRVVLPSLPGFSGITVRGMNSAGWVAGYAGLLGTTTRAVVWKPRGVDAYDIVDLGLLPGTSTATASGIDSLGRVVGYSTTLNFPPTGAPFMWTETGGLVDLTTLGFPNESPVSISAGGTVAISNSWYRLDQPGIVNSVAPAPQGFYPPVGGVINDAGDHAEFLFATSSQSLGYLFRYHHEGTWQQIGFTGNGHLASFGVGSINAAQDVTATDLGSATIASGPDGASQALSPLLSPAYRSATISVGGPLNTAGQILAQMFIGNSPRLVRLTPPKSCGTNCVKVNALQIQGKFIDDPNNPGQCTSKARNHVTVRLQVTDNSGAKLPGVLVRGRFLDDYWMNKPVSATTNAQGNATLVHDGLACVGAVAFLVERATKGALVLDRTTGVLTGSVIPLR